ncbi:MULTISPECIES: hypothetical protein [Streptosporangium]|uniref:Uncharacterized protein n=1 Tax=Streptosporangium brasiliense TaxID=47480 RepID=A0ABT9RMS5_9ACTN|nr:hypothetical protein [Streptosporangium brasiliense]MDP9870383.1 hypothetical protein [Streptosporangium brasiliense]
MRIKNAPVTDISPADQLREHITKAARSLTYNACGAYRQAAKYHHPDFTQGGDAMLWVLYNGEAHAFRVGLAALLGLGESSPTVGYDRADEMLAKCKTVTCDH